jgi:hypothetical protein
MVPGRLPSLLSLAPAMATLVFGRRTIRHQLHGSAEGFTSFESGLIRSEGW